MTENAFSDMLLPERQFPSEEGPCHLHLATVQKPVENKVDFH